MIEDERLLQRIRELHAANYFAYGSRRMWIPLGRAGERVGRGRVEGLMRTHGIQGAKRRAERWKTGSPRALGVKVARRGLREQGLRG